MMTEMPVEELSYEAAFEELEQVIARLETSQENLEEAIRLYERGRLLTERCNALLDQAELRIRQLSPEEIDPGV